MLAVSSVHCNVRKKNLNESNSAAHCTFRQATACGLLREASGRSGSVLHASTNWTTGVPPAWLGVMAIRFLYFQQAAKEAVGATA